MKPNTLRNLLASVPAIALCAVTAHAQTVTGNIVGNVTDPSGAVIPGATITAHNVDTGVDSKSTSNSAGLYRIEFLPIGRYSVTINASGFGQQDVPPFQLEALQTANFNIKLTVGSATTTVEVSAAAPILDTNDATLSGTFTANTIQNFPLNGLDFSALTLYVPGSVSTAGTGGTTSIERSTQYTDTVNVNGNRAQSNNFTLDGIDINETFNNLISYSPAPESLQEVKVLTANSPADYGNVNGGGVIAILKSGTDRFHGSAYGYVQDYRLNANSYSNNQSGTAINPFSQAQFGGTFGGPIKKDKLFFFVDYLGSRYHKGGVSHASLFTQAMRNGDFSALLSTANGNTPTQLYDSENGFKPFVGDVGIPIVNPVARFLFANPNLYPLPNATPTDGILQNNYAGVSRNFKANNQGDVKLEFDPRPSDKITGFFSISTAYDGSTAVLPIFFPTVNLFPSKVFGLNWVHIVSPSIVNSARVGFTRTVWDEGLPIDTTGAFGTMGDAKVGINFPNQNYQGFTFQGISAYNGGGGNAVSGFGTDAQNNGSIIDNTYSYIDNVTISHGRHTLSMGVEAIRYQNNYPTSNNNGYLGSESYSGVFSSNPAAAAPGGYGGADFVLDRVSGAVATLSSINVGQRQWRDAGFLNDDFKLLPNLTLNFGVRYEWDEPWIEQNNKTGNIDEATGQVLYAVKVPAGAPAGSGICKNRGCYDSNFTQIMPRIGFSYQAKNNFVIRGGYGASSFYEGNSSNQRLTSITPFIQAISVSTIAPTAGNGGTPRTAEQGFAGGTANNSGTYNVYPQNIQPAYIQEYSLTTEYAISHNLSLQVGYLGEQGQHIEDYGNLNQYLVNGDPTSAPYYNNQYIGHLTNPATSVGSNGLLVTESRAAMNYNSLQTVLRQRTSKGLEFTVNYTYSKALTNSLGNYGLQVSGFSGAFQNYYDSAADWGPAGYDVRHNVSATAVYALPVGRGKQYLSGVNRIVDEAIGGWKVSIAAVGYSGLPETATSPGSNNANSYGTTRPNQYRRLKIVNRSLTHWYGTDPSATACGVDANGNIVDNGICAFGVPANNTFGNARNGNLRGPGYFNMDASAFKDFHTFREQTLGFRFDAFNAFNIVSYGNPDSGVTDGNFGNVATQGPRSVERHLQFSANYRF